MDFIQETKGKIKAAKASVKKATAVKAVALAGVSALFTSCMGAMPSNSGGDWNSFGSVPMTSGYQDITVSYIDQNGARVTKRQGSQFRLRDATRAINDTANAFDRFSRAIDRFSR